MPTGVILSSASPGATQDAVQKVLAANGYEVETPASVETEVIEEPKRDAFDTEEEFEAAHVEWQDKQPKETEEEDEEEEVVAQPAKKPSKFQKRIHKITSRLETENAELKKRLEELEGKGGKKEEVKEANPRPLRSAFPQTDQGQLDYEDALVKWGAEKTLAEKTVKEQQAAEKERLETNLTNYRAQVAEFKASHEDWDDVVNQDIPMHVSVQLAIMEQENGAAIVYHLGRHPEYAKKLASLSPLSAVMEVGRLSTKLTAASGSSGSGTGRRATEKPKPRVPAPIRPVSTAATTSTLTSRDAAAKRDFRAFKVAQRAGR